MRKAGYGDKWFEFESGFDQRVADAMRCPDVGMREVLDILRKEFIEVIAEEGARWSGVSSIALKLVKMEKEIHG